MRTERYWLQCQVHLLVVAIAPYWYNHDFTVARVLFCSNTIVFSTRECMCTPTAFCLVSISELEDVVHTATVGTWTQDDRTVRKFFSLRFVTLARYTWYIHVTENLPVATEVIRVNHEVTEIVVLVASQHTSIQTVVIAYLSTCTLHDTTRADEHGLDRTYSRFIQWYIELVCDDAWLAPSLTTVFTMHDSHLVRYFAAWTEEYLVSGYTKKQYTVAFAVCNQTWVAITGSKRLVRVLIYHDAVAFDDSEYIAPSLTIVLADTSVKVYTTITNISTARTWIGYCQQITLWCLGDRWDTVRSHVRILSGEHFERTLFFINYLLTLFSTTGQCSHTERSNEQTGKFFHKMWFYKIKRIFFPQRNEYILNYENAR